MADLGEGFELCKVPSGDEVLGAEKHCEEDFIILTLRSREVLIYNIADRKIVKSWSVELKQKLFCAAVQDFKTTKYFMLRNEKQLLTWDDTVADLKKATITQLPKVAKKIYSCSSKTFCHEPLIIFEDSDVQPVSVLGNEAQKKSKQSNQRLLWCGSHKSTNERLWFSKILMDKDLKVKLVMQLIESSLLSENEYVYNIKSPTPDGKLLCWSVSNDNGKPLYISLWSDGCLYKADVPTVNSSEDSESQKNVLHYKFLAKLPKCTSTPFQVPGYLLSIVDSNSFICVATSSMAGGESTQMQDTISFWDIKFGTLHCQKTLSDILKHSINTPRGISHLLCSRNFIVMTSNSSVTVCTYKAEKPTLKNSLGKFKDMQREGANLKPLFLGSPNLIRPSEMVQVWTDSVSKIDETEEEVLTRILNPKQTKTSKQLAIELENYSKLKMDYKGQDDKQLKEISNRQKKRDAAKPPIVSEYFITCLFERCIQEKNLWSHGLGMFFIQINRLSQRLQGQLVEMILENNDILLLRESFQKLVGIPETSIIDCLKYILSVNDSNFVSDTEEEWTNSDPPCCLSKARYLCLVLAYPVNDIFLQENLKRLSFQETITFIQFLLHLVRNWRDLFQSMLNTKDVTRKLKYTHILDWTGLTLNAHFTQLILFPDAQKLLVNLHEAVAEQITTHEHFEELEGYLSHFQNHKPLPRQDYLGAYTIESMEL